MVGVLEFRQQVFRKSWEAKTKGYQKSISTYLKLLISHQAYFSIKMPRKKTGDAGFVSKSEKKNNKDHTMKVLQQTVL